MILDWINVKNSFQPCDYICSFAFSFQHLYDSFAIDFLAHHLPWSIAALRYTVESTVVFD